MLLTEIYRHHFTDKNSTSIQAARENTTPGFTKSLEKLRIQFLAELEIGFRLVNDMQHFH
jgi:hypothetical protein